MNPLCPLPPIFHVDKRSAGSRLGRTVSERQAQWSDKLLSAIERESIDQVRAELEADKTEPDAVLTAPSLVEKHGFRTPLMAAVARGDLPIFTTLLRRFEARFSKNVRRIHQKICSIQDARKPRFAVSDGLSDNA